MYSPGADKMRSKPKMARNEMEMRTHIQRVEANFVRPRTKKNAARRLRCESCWKMGEYVFRGFQASHILIQQHACQASGLFPRADTRLRAAETIFPLPDPVSDIIIREILIPSALRHHP